MARHFHTWIVPVLVAVTAGCQTPMSPLPTGTTGASDSPGGAAPASGQPASGADAAPGTPVASSAPVVVAGSSPTPPRGGAAGGSGGAGSAGGGSPGGSSGGEQGGSTTPVAFAVSAVSASTAHPGYGPERATDGDLATQWTGGQVAGASLTLEFTREAPIEAMSLKTGPTPVGASLIVEVSNDGATWQQVLTARITSWNKERLALPEAPTARFMRLRQESAATAAFAVFEVEVHASAYAVAAPPSTSGTTIVVSPEVELHRAESRLLGTNRNHVTDFFTNRSAKLAKLRELTPQWGDRKYLYRIGHGPTDGRTDYGYMTGYHFEQSWNKTNQYPYDDIREGLKDANELGADQMHVINYGTSDPAEAGRYVSYLNKSGDANRASYPYPQQNVKLFEIGNEIAWNIVRGHNEFAPNERVYAERAKLFAQEMRRNSDGPILVGANGSINSNWEGNGWSGGATTVKNILTIMGDQVDFLIYHGYPSWPLYKSGDLLTLIAQNEWNRQKLETEIKPAIRAHAGGRDVFIANTEFFTHMYNDVTRSRGLFGALYSADTLTLAFNQDIRTAVQFAVDHDDMADDSFFIKDDPNNTTAIFKFQKMLAEHWGDTIVKTTGHQIPSVNVAGASTSLTLPKLAYTAAKAGDKVYVMVTHRTNDADVAATIDVGFKPSRVTAWELSDPSGWNAANASVATIQNPSLTGYTFKKSSVTILEVTR